MLRAPSAQATVSPNIPDALQQSALWEFVTIPNLRKACKGMQTFKSIQSKLINGLQFDVVVSAQLLNNPNHTGQTNLRWCESYIEIQGRCMCTKKSGLSTFVIWFYFRSRWDSLCQMQSGSI